VTRVAALRGGIIAAGEGSRLREAGFSMPKPLVPVAGVALIEWVLRNFVAVGIVAPVIIVNEDAGSCVPWIRSRFPELEIDFIVKTTASSLESFLAVSRRLGGGRALISTVDAWCRPDDFVRFVAAALRHPPDVSVLAATPFVDDEKPLWVNVDHAGRVRELGGSSGTLATAGMYLMSERALTATVPPPGRLRDFLSWLVRQGEPVYVETIPKVVDVDRASDVAQAEALAHGAGASPMGRA
jgi:NDP-sugar pyrophosphorylase family protein